MALTYDTINSIVRDALLPVLINNVQYSNVLWYRIYQKRKKWLGGQKMQVPVRVFHNDNTLAYTGADTLTVAKKEIATKMELPFRSYNNAIYLEGDDYDAVQSSKEKVIDIVKSYMEAAEDHLKKTFSDDILNGVGASKQFDGIESAIGTSAYGGIDPADATEWQSTVDSTTTTLTPIELATFYQNLTFGNEKPTLILCDAALYPAIEMVIFQPNQRYSDSKLAELGFENLKYRKAIITADANVDAGHILFINENFLEFRVLKDFEFVDFMSPTNQDVMIGHIRFKGNLFVKNRKLQGKMTAITTVSAS